MKTRILLLAMMCFCVMAVSVKASPFYQEEDPAEAPAAQGKKMNFQGTLYENGEPVTGERSFTFTIALGDGEEWTETHENVQVVEGLYAVLLGSIDPLPADLFFEAEERDLTIAVGNTVLGTTQLLAPFGLNNGKNFNKAQFDLVIETDADSAAVSANISGMGLSGNRPANAIYANAETDSLNTAVFGRSVGTVDNVSFQTGLRGHAVNDGTSWATGVWGRGIGNGGGTTYGIRGETYGEGNGFSAAARALNFVTSTDAPISRYGGLFDTRFGPDAATNLILGTSFGVAGIARGSEVNYGVYGSASGGEGSLNYAGFFQGDTKVIGTLFTTRDDGFGAELNNFSIMHRGSDGEVNAMLGNNWIDGGSNVDNRGALFLFADTLERFNREGADIRRVELRARGDGYGGSTGALSLRSYDGEKVFAGIETFDGENYFSVLRLDGATSNNFNFTASDYPNGNAARMTMSGGLERVDGDGNGFIPELVNLNIGRTTDFEGNEEERAALTLASTYSGMTTLSTEELTMRSNDYTNTYFSVGARNNGEGGRNGFLSMQGNLEHSDSEGNTYVPTLVDLNIFKSTETNESVSLNLRTTEGGSINLSPDGISLGQAGYQPFSINSFEDGAGGRSIQMNMTGSLENEDEFGNIYRSQLMYLGTGGYGDGLEQANFSLSRNNGYNVNIDPSGISFNGNNGQPMSLSAHENSFGNINGNLRMQSGVAVTDGEGNTFTPELLNLGINAFDESSEQASLRLASTTGANVELSSNGLIINESDYQPLALYTYDNGIGGRNLQMNMTGSLLVEDEFGNSYRRQLVGLGINSSGEGSEQANFSLGHTDGRSIDVNVDGIRLNDGTGNQAISLATNENGFGRRNSALRIQSGLAMDSEDGTFSYFPELATLTVDAQSETLESAQLTLGSTDGRNVSLSRNGLNMAADGYTPVSLDVFDDGSGNLNGVLNIRGAIQRMDEGQDFSYNPELVRISGDRQDETNEIGQINLSATDGTNFGINAYGFSGITNGLQTRSMGMIATNSAEVLNMSTYDDGQGNDLAVMRIRDVSNDFADLARIESVNETDIFGRLVLDKRDSPTDQFRIDANGVFGGTDVFQNGLALNYDGTGGAFLQMYAEGNQNVLIEGATGNMTIAGSLSQSSDARLKKNVETLTSGLAIVGQLRGVRYNWKDESRTEDKIGFLAQEVEAVLPELVVTKKDGLKAVNYAEMTAVLVEAVKELSQEIAELKKENSTLKAELTKAEELESRLARIEAMLTVNESKETVKAGQK